MKQLFTKLPRPFIVGVIHGKTPQDVMASMRNAGYDGAHAYNLHISKLAPQYLEKDSLKKIIESTCRPVCALYYAYMPYTEQQSSNANLKGDNEALRIEKLLLAVEAGAAAIDMPADTFRAASCESGGKAKKNSGQLQDGVFEGLKLSGITFEKAALEKQAQMIDKVHSYGSEVLLSVHTGTVMNSAQTLKLAENLEKRGADMLKIVNACNNHEEMAEGIKTIIELKKNIKTPFLYICQGEYGKLTRVVGPMLGCMLAYCVHEYNESTHLHQPLIKSLRNVLQEVDWTVPE